MRLNTNRKMGLNIIVLSPSNLYDGINFNRSFKMHGAVNLINCENKWLSVKRKNDMRIRRLIHFKVRSVPFWVIGLGGLAGVLLDLDHPISYWIAGYTSRAAHIPFALISSLVLCGVSAYCGGLYCKVVLTKNRKQPAFPETLAPERDGKVRADV